MLISLADYEDLVEIENCGRSCLPIYYKEEELRMIFIKENYKIFKATIDDKIVAFLVLKEDDTNVHIMSIGVLEKYRKLKIGTELINKIKINFLNKSISLNVQESNEVAINFYIKNGFKVNELLKNYYMTLDCNNAYKMTFIQ